jgi:nicotinamide-nucleotide amidase
MGVNNIKAEVITIGDEILYGHILDTNAQWLSEQMDDAGIQVVHRTTIGDNEPAILNALKAAEDRADIVLITGGLGPTADDLTKPCLARYFNVELELNETALKELQVIFDHIGREMTETNRNQVVLPVNCDYVSNSLGTAPGMWFEENNTVFVSMPGVPFEMKKMMEDTILPKLQNHFQVPVVYHKIIKTIGIGESWLADKIHEWEESMPDHIKLAYLPSLGQVKLRLTCVGKNPEQIKSEVDQRIAALRPYAGQYIYGFDHDTIEQVIGNILNKKELTIATAESCTGGYLAHLITSVPGSSAYYRGSVLAYANDVKTKHLGVSPDTLATYGAVSEETVIEMAQGVRATLNTDVGIATSGIAGPDGGTADKPVGTIWVAVVTPDQKVTKKLTLYKDRLLNIKATAVASLAITWQTLR